MNRVGIVTMTSSIWGKGLNASDTKMGIGQNELFSIMLRNCQGERKVQKAKTYGVSEVVSLALNDSPSEAGNTQKYGGEFLRIKNSGAI